MSSIPQHAKIALVTGANKGIGLAISKSLSQKSRGYHILLGSRDIQRGYAAALALKREGHSVEAISLDLSVDSSIIAAVELVSSTYGRLDVLINNAGISSDDEVDLSLRERFEKTYNVNVFGAAIVTEMFIPLLSKSTAPRVVFVSSNLGSLTLKSHLHSPMSSITVPIYRSSKAAMNMIMLHYAHLYEKHGWKVNACHPGFTSTDLTGGRGGSVDEAAKVVVKLAMLEDDAETGTFSEIRGRLPW